MNDAEIQRMAAPTVCRACAMQLCQYLTTIAKLRDILQSLQYNENHYH